MTAYWKTLMEQRDRGCEIDRLAMDDCRRAGEYRVIPCPSRRSGGSWVHAPVPLIPAASGVGTGDPALAAGGSRKTVG